MTLPVLKLSGDRKVANAVTNNGKLPKINNAFGLLSGKAFSCSTATSVCEEVCYAGKLERLFPNVRALLTHNWEAVRNAGLTDLVDMLQNMVNSFTLECDKEDKRRAKRGDSPVPRAFRIHWDGDFFSLTYANAWATIVEGNPEIAFWVYTRAFTNVLNVLPAFDALMRRESNNLAFYLSVDSDNLNHAKVARKEYTWARWAWLAETFADGKAEIEAAGSDARKYNCPENGGRIPLIDTKGSACLKCGICVDGRGDVLFSIRKR